MKQGYIKINISIIRSLPVRGRGLKLDSTAAEFTGKRSLPVRGRGLKQGALLQAGYPRIVAPRAGAWIETLEGGVTSMRPR